MLQILTDWLTLNYLELLGALLGLVYVIFSVRQNILTWPAGLATSLFYIAVYFQSRIYANMGLQVYYVVMSLYGWYYWLKGARPEKSEKLPVTRINGKQMIVSAGIFLFCFGFLYLFLSRFTDSPVPVLDSLTTSLSIVATWLLARKILENWLLWVVADLTSTGLYIYRGLWPTTCLFLVYSGLAIFGYFQWKRSISQPSR